MQTVAQELRTLTLLETGNKFQVSRSALKTLAKKVPGARKDPKYGWLLPHNIQITKERTGLKFFLDNVVEVPSSSTQKPSLEKNVKPTSMGIDVLESSEVLETGLRAFLEKIGIDGLLALPKARQALGHALIQEIWETVKP